MIDLRCRQRTIYEAIGEAVIPDEERLHWESWMIAVDTLLEDEELVELVHTALKKRRPQSATRGRRGTPADVALRLCVLKHMKNWSFETMEREVRANLVYRRFVRLAGSPVPDRSTMKRLAQAIGPDATRAIHERVVELARDKRVIAGRRMRIDTTAVETDIHYPTDSSLLADGTRVMTRLVNQIRKMVGDVTWKVRDRTRTVKRQALQIARASRDYTERGKQKRRQIYEKLMVTTKLIIRAAGNVARDVGNGTRSAADAAQRKALEKLSERLKRVIEVTCRVVEQTKARVIDGNTHYDEKVLSIFEASTEAIRRGKASHPTEFGKMIKIQEAENQITVDYEVYGKKPADSELLVPAIEKHRDVFGRAPDLVAADAGFYSADNETRAAQAGVKRVAIAYKNPNSKAAREKKKHRWFKRAQRWRTGCEGRISVLKRRHGLVRCRYKGVDGMHRWVGMGVIADNLINIGKVTASK